LIHNTKSAPPIKILSSSALIILLCFASNLIYEILLNKTTLEETDQVLLKEKGSFIINPKLEIFVLHKMRTRFLFEIAFLNAYKSPLLKTYVNLI